MSITKAIVNAKVVHERGIIWDGAILVENDRIKAYGKRKDVEIPEGAEVIDAEGAYAPDEAASYTLTHSNGKNYTLTVTVDSAWMMAFNEKGEMMEPNGGITLYIGGHQPDPVSCRLTGTACERMELK